MRDRDAIIPFIEGRLRTPFAWGRARNDCVSFAVAAVKRQTGKDVLTGSGLRWRSEAGAERALAREGGLAQAIGRRLKRIAVAEAGRGDIALAIGASGPFLAVVEGETLAAPGPEGLQRFPRAAMRRAWEPR